MSRGDGKVLQYRLLITGGSGFVGRNLIPEVSRRGMFEFLNLDVTLPRGKDYTGSYRRCDLLDALALNRCLDEFQPTHVVHLAARTDMLGRTVEDYAANHVGTKNLVEAMQGKASIKKVIFTSSQYVVGPGGLPESDEDYRPHTIYGESKVRSEKVIRAAKLPFSWTIIRPTNIWGPWHPRYPNEFWRVVKQGRYVHPGGAPVMRCYGYIGNVVEQILTIIERRDNDLDGKTLYVGDPPIDIYHWANAFSLELTGKPARVVPRGLLRGLAKVGDIANRVGFRSPIFTSRFQSMTESYVTPMEQTYDLLGSSRISMEEGVRETVKWLREEDSFWARTEVR
jgi:nucleoside-diphosphate-sugar epimerase